MSLNELLAMTIAIVKVDVKCCGISTAGKRFANERHDSFTYDMASLFAM